MLDKRLELDQELPYRVWTTPVYFPVLADINSVSIFKTKVSFGIFFLFLEFLWALKSEMREKWIRVTSLSK